MGHQIRAGESAIRFTDGAWLVVNWCERFTPKVKPEGMSDREWFEETCGVTDITAASARIANEHVPFAFEEAEAGGFLGDDYNGPIREREFRECREFLRYAAEGGHDISGSY